MSQSLGPGKSFALSSEPGFFVHHARGSHYFLRHPDRPGILVTVPYHNRDLKRGTLRSILRQAGFSPDQFRTLL
jgi:predicted RNA binding protein YcfA (HicA-like mRNA interferase family)